MSSGKMIASATALIVAIGALAGAVSTLWKQVDEMWPGRLKDGQKICRAVAPNLWTDSVVVPRTWTAETCKEFSSSERGTSYYLGCAFPKSVSFGAQSELLSAPNLPASNCGW